MEVTKTWAELKTLVASKELRLQYDEPSGKDDYDVFAVDGQLIYVASIEKGSSDATDFEANYEPTANNPVLLKTDKETATIKMAKGKADTVDGVATIYIKIPGTPGSDVRNVKGGEGWFGTQHLDDYVKVYLEDKDGIQYAAGTIIGSYTDDEAESSQQGWYIPKSDGKLVLSAFEALADLPSGFYLKIVAIKGDSSSDTFRMNMIWGKR